MSHEDINSRLIKDLNLRPEAKTLPEKKYREHFGTRTTSWTRSPKQGDKIKTQKNGAISNKEAFAQQENQWDEETSNKMGKGI